MMKFTNDMKIKAEMALRSLSDKAAWMYAGTDPLTVYQTGDDEFSMRGGLGDEDRLTFEKLQRILEEYADEIGGYTPPEPKPKKITPQKKWDAAHKRSYRVECFTPSEDDIISQLEKKRNSEGYATYIKRLIREDISRD